MFRGYVKIHRSMKEWCLYKVDGATHLLNHLILSATHKEIKISLSGKPYILKPGQLVTGRKQLSEETGLSEQKIRTLIGKFLKFKEITRFSTNKYTVITLVKWEQFQIEEENQPTINQQATSKQPLNKNVKNDKNKDNIIYSKHSSDNFKSAFYAYMEMRQKIKKTMTAHAIELAIKKLDNYDEATAIQMLDNSTFNNWQGLFEIKKDQVSISPPQRDSRPTPDYILNQVKSFDRIVSGIAKAKEAR